MMNGNGNSGGSWFDYDKRLRPEMLKDKRVTVIVRSVGEIKLDLRGKTKTVPVLFFEKTDKYFELNDTNRMTLVHLFGDNKSDCVGKAIDLQTEEVQGGKIGIVIHESPKRGATRQPEAQPAPANSDDATPSNPFLDAARRLKVSDIAIDEYLKRAGGDPSKAFDLLSRQFYIPK